MNDHCLACNSLFCSFLYQTMESFRHSAPQIYWTEIHHGLHVCKYLRALAGNFLQLKSLQLAATKRYVTSYDIQDSASAASDATSTQCAIALLMNSCDAQQ